MNGEIRSRKRTGAAREKANKGPEGEKYGEPGKGARTKQAVAQERWASESGDSEQLARELHDRLSPILYGIALAAKTARARMDEQTALTAELPAAAQMEAPIEMVIELAEDGLAELRALIFDLRPRSLMEQGLAAALATQVRAFGARNPVEAVFLVGEEPPVSLEIKEALYRVAMEALNNVQRHAGASRVRVRLEWDLAGLCLEIQDNGRGMESGPVKAGHLGLGSMRKRVEELGGRFEVLSRKGEGTEIRVEMKL